MYYSSTQSLQVHRDAFIPTLPWEDTEVSPCRKCKHFPENQRKYWLSEDPLSEAGWSSKTCRTHTDCPMNTPRESISCAQPSDNSRSYYPEPTEVCIFPGCDKKAIENSNLCSDCNALVYNRRVTLGWPEERWFEPKLMGKIMRNTCKVVGCDNPCHKDVCKDCRTTVEARKYKLKWPEERWFETIKRRHKK